MVYSMIFSDRIKQMKKNHKIKKQMRYLLFLFVVFLISEEYIMPMVSSWGQKDTYASQLLQTNELAEQNDVTLDLASPSVILMEASTGSVIYEKEADIQRSPASITKIMTLLIIFENIKEGKLRLDEEVTTSAYAKSMGGSQVFLEEGEKQTVDTLIKCIAVASGNDASVAMAEKIAGSEEAFVTLMNQKAKEIGLEHTHFVDCCGLTSSDQHYTTARDIAVMARCLIQNYPEIMNYTKIWMEDIIHQTKNGNKPFTLSSTNKLLKQYEYTTGLKTGSTSLAKYCFCATARKDGMDLIAVVMASPDHKVRFEDAKKLLTYGYSISKIYEDLDKNEFIIHVINGKHDKVTVHPEKVFRYLDVTGADLKQVEKQIHYEEVAKAPIEKGDKAGEIVYRLSGNIIGKMDLLFDASIEKAGYRDVFGKVFRKMLL